jgi:hypothetical protein
MIAILLLAGVQTLSFSCLVDPPRNVSVNGDSATSKVIGLPAEMNKWKFDLAIMEKSDTVDVKLDWPGDPIRVGNALAAMEIGPHDYSFVSVHPGPCLFTPTSCMFMYTLSIQKDSSAQILIQPSAVDTDGEWSKPFQAFMTGRCTPKGAVG